MKYEDVDNYDEIKNLPRLYIECSQIICVRLPDVILAKYSKVMKYDYLRLGCLKYFYTNTMKLEKQFCAYHRIVPNKLAHKYMAVKYESCTYKIYEIVLNRRGKIRKHDHHFCPMDVVEYIQQLGPDRIYKHIDHKKISFDHPSDMIIVCEC